MTRYESAKEIFAKYGVDTDEAIAKCKSVPVSLHCWQGDDVTGFDHDGPLTGGIQTTGNYPGKARNPEELLADMDKAMSLMPGAKKINVHACYAIFEDGEFADRDKLEPKHFQKWVDFAKERGMGLDFNPTFFSHPKVKDGLTLSSPDEETRKFWIEHGKACIRISSYFAEQTGIPCVMNIWTGDGYKDIPADRMGPRMRYKESIDEILSEPYDPKMVKPCVESKVFGIGVEAYTVGSAEFSLSYAAANIDKCLPLMDNGHYHPTEVVSDKIPALLCFFPEIALHVTRPIRWDSDHVVLLDDETKEIAKEIVRCEGGLERTYIALDYFDASINRISAWVTGFRSFQKALLQALCTPNEMLKELQDKNEMTKKMVMQEEVKDLPFGDVWEQYCAECGVAATGWLEEVEKYEAEVLSKRA
ncbi:MAG: L-rhamnose isomerase [Lachnospiraceae bacterium]|nr:L-rhamnose isomerase [Lachnospiraceae bacterium]